MMNKLRKMTREEQKNIFGGSLEASTEFLDSSSGGSCRISVSYPGGGFARFDTPTSGSCRQQSQQANNQCLVAGAGQGGVRCSYDCACDGYGN